MYKSLMVPLDGSAFAEEAIPLGELLARQLGAELHLVHVILPARDVDFKTPQQDFDWKETVWDSAEAYLERHAEAGRSQGVSVLTGVLEGRVSTALGAYVEEQEIDLVVLTSHGSGGVRRWWLGSVADSLLRRGGFDLLLVRPWDETGDREAGSPRFEKVMVPLDGSELAEGALEAARDLAETFGSRMKLVRITPKPVELTSIYGVRGVELRGAGHEERLEEAEAYLADAATRHAYADLEVGALEASGAAEGIVEAARSWNADLIVLSSHGRGGVERLVLGSVADKVVRSTTRPVLVTRRQPPKGSNP